MLALTKWRGTPSDPAAPPPRTLAAQSRLRRLPVPPLEQTLAKYLRSLQPLLQQMEERGQLAEPSVEAAMHKREQWAQELLQSKLGRVLQQRLVDVDSTTPNNWLDDRFWLQKAYHEWRVPLLINSNWWLLLTNDPSLLSTSDASIGEHKGHGQALPVGAEAQKAAVAAGTELPPVSELLGEKRWDEMELGIRRAAWLTWRLVEFKLRLDREDILPDASKAGPFCMHQYTNVYGVTRIPALPHDWNTRPSPRAAGVSSTAANRSDPPARHVTVIVRNHFYELQVIDDAEGKIIRPEALELALRHIVQDVQAREEDGEGVGVLSADERDRWAITREQLAALSPANAQSLRSIERSLFALSLDTSVLPLPSQHPAPALSASPEWVDALARNCSGAGRAGHNRWFDKSINLVVEPNGRAGINGEHSPVDALIPSILADYATGVPCPPPGALFPAVDTTSPADLSDAPAAAHKRLDFTLDDALHAEIRAATRRALAISAGTDLRVLYYNEYGADWIKKVAKQSPDAYLQQALQVAHALTHGWQVPTYETASTRLFKHGRTDVIRSFSTESYAFVKALLRGGSCERNENDMQALYRLLTAATQAHNAQTRESSTGKGIDRHLTGLRLVFNPQTDGGADALPQLFRDPLFTASQTWTLSTSGLSAGDRLAGTGFGAGYDDGYGCNYLAGGTLLKFGLESKHANAQTSTTAFAQNLVRALRLMRDVCERGIEPADAAVDAKGKL
ncbi:acyltransferase ChoActase/COT/CPT [Tilletiaria anomala UBC 951]|uniref:Acyltransferase ChoActase/COT/CPT n=1 Tax=Tilletiaria anomala (strain ATCC 24038 / CBS 436.72 / UBC 951) TaxID=1037660 RepID=A0A066VZJ8_TILAU|nr:acyltransferase ChoActase/COT/CPT [Tilletiaria anomala UBC 951]KDN43950.1 acyltransferase ChoActase/COT/CPT [Tilletiaria anomala UBC 951]